MKCTGSHKTKRRPTILEDIENAMKDNTKHNRFSNPETCMCPDCIQQRKEDEEEKREEEEEERREKEYQKEMDDAKPHCCGEVMRFVIGIGRSDPETGEHERELWQCVGTCKQVREDKAVYTGHIHPSNKENFLHE